MQEKLKYIPDCNCLEKISQQEQEEREKALEKERVLNKIKKYRDISVIDKKLVNSRFENAEMTDRHMSLCKRYAEKFRRIILLHLELVTFRFVYARDRNLIFP